MALLEQIFASRPPIIINIQAFAGPKIHFIKELFIKENEILLAFQDYQSHNSSNIQRNSCGETA